MGLFPYDIDIFCDTKVLIRLNTQWVINDKPKGITQVSLSEAETEKVVRHLVS